MRREGLGSQLQDPRVVWQDSKQDLLNEQDGLAELIRHHILPGAPIGK